MTDACSGIPGAQARAQASFTRLFQKLAALFTCGDASTLSQAEAAQLAQSLAYALGLTGADADVAMAELAASDPEELFRRRQAGLRRRVRQALRLWEQVVRTMPPIRNVALRDTLASIGELERNYDAYFAAHEVPCSIDYPLSMPVSPDLLGIDYVQAYLEQLLRETRWIAQFEPQSCIEVLERACPDYRGLHVNLYELLAPHERELVRA